MASRDEEERMWTREYDEALNTYVNVCWPGTTSEQIWQEHYDQEGSLFYYEQHSGQTAWYLPELYTQGQNYHPDYDQSYATNEQAHEYVATDGSELHSSQDESTPQLENQAQEWWQDGDQLLAENMEAPKESQSMWRMLVDENSGYYYYLNIETGESSWTLPENASLIEQQPEEGKDEANLKQELQEAMKDQVDQRQQQEANEDEQDHEGQQKGNQVTNERDESSGENIHAAEDDETGETEYVADEGESSKSDDENNSEGREEEPTPSSREPEKEETKEVRPEEKEEGEEDIGIRRSKSMKQSEEKGNKMRSRTFISRQESKKQARLLRQRQRRKESDALEKTISWRNAPAPTFVSRRSKFGFFTSQQSSGYFNVDDEVRGLFREMQLAVGKSETALSKSDILKALATNRNVQRSIREANFECLKKAFRPKTIGIDFSLADKNKDGLVDEEEFVNFFHAIPSREMAKEKRLRPYKFRTKGRKRTLEFETILVKVDIPEDIKTVLQLDNKYDSMYSHISRRKEFERFLQRREKDWAREKIDYRRSTENRGKLEVSLVQAFEQKMKREEEKEIRERQRQRQRLAKKNEELLKQEAVPFIRNLIAKAENVQHEGEHGQDSKRLQGTLKRGPSLFGRRFSLTRRDSQKQTTEQTPVEQQIQEEEDHEETIRKLTGQLTVEGKLEFDKWTQETRTKQEKTLESKMNKRIAKFAKRKAQMAEEESHRRKEFEKETKEIEERFVQRSIDFERETRQVIDAGRRLEQLEARAFAKIQAHRKAFLSVVSLCFDRALMRRMAYQDTLQIAGKFNRMLHLVRDALTGVQMVLTILPVSKGESQIEKREQCEALVRTLRTYQTASKPVLLSRAQRMDDRIPAFSKYVAEIEHVFTHKINANNMVFAFVRYYSGGTLKDVLHELYSNTNQVVCVPEMTLLKWGEQLARAVRALHNHNLAHLGIEPGCIFLDTRQDIKLGFPKDLSSMYDGNQADSVCISITLPTSYSAPELSAVEGTSRPQAADIWSIGSVLFTLGTGSPPARNSSLSISRLVAMPKVRRFKRWFRDSLRMTLQNDPTRRGSIFDLLDFLNDSADTAFYQYQSQISSVQFCEE